jgi:2-keto-4-pentenoate hydratase/2-oxohepta-3-ene-1,7-dioic acid hydratase in catechol pathway
MKPPSALVPPGEPLRLPRKQGAVHHELELVLRIGKEGKHIPRSDALAYIDALALGIDLTLRDMQKDLKQAGRPWEACKAFDGSAPLGDFVSLDGIDLADITMTCHVNGTLRQSGHTGDMLFPVFEIIGLLSETWRLYEGDLVFTGTPPGVGPLEPGDEITLASPEIGSVSWHCQ